MNQGRAATSRTTVVVGASFDVGRACALRAGSQGGSVVLLDEKREPLELVAAEVEARGARPVVIELPLEDVDGLRHVVDLLPNEIQHCDSLVNAQFAFDLADIVDVELERWARVLTVNLTGVVAVTQALHPLLARSSSASVVNVGSIDGLQGNPWLPAYSASKGGLVALTHVMAHSYGREGIRVNYVARCGTIEMAEALMLQGVRVPRPDWHTALERVTPLGRIGSADETAAVVEFLASTSASFVNGAVLAVDGGRTGITPGVV